MGLGGHHHFYADRRRLCQSGKGVTSCGAVQALRLLALCCFSYAARSSEARFTRTRSVPQSRCRFADSSRFECRAVSFLQHGSSLAFKTFHHLLGILRLDSNFFQGCAKMLDEQVKVPIVQTFISGPGMGVTNILPCIYSSA
jgi:hypothetical protein